jgi:hypothetical protein
MPLSAVQIKLTWNDNSNNEVGFKLYRDSKFVTEIPKDEKEFTDSQLRPATSYHYEIEAYNLVGTSKRAEFTIRTPNPPIVIWIDSIGVHNTGEEGEIFRALFDDPAGEIYVGISIINGSTQVNKRLPDSGTYKLAKDQRIQVNKIIYMTPEVGDNLTIIIIGGEEDGGFGEQLLYKALDIITKSYIGNPTALILTLGGVDFSKIFSDIFGAEDDYMGEYHSTWTIENNWGVGSYSDIKCSMKNGEVGLRLWVRVECPIYDYSLEKSRP